MANEIQGDLFKCQPGEHEYEPADQGYYKEDSAGNRVKGKVYRMIYCIKCGDNREIMVVDRTPYDDNTKKKVTRKRGR